MFSENDYNCWGGWTIVVVYKNVSEAMRNLTVFDGFANISDFGSVSYQSVDIPISGFVTPPSGPINFELGVVAYDGDRQSTGDQMKFNGTGSFLNVQDQLHNPTNLFNSTISNNGMLTPFRIPSYNNTLGQDANIFLPDNTSFAYLPNNAISAAIRISTGGESILAQVVTSVIDVYEPDLRATVYIDDLNGGIVNPGDTLEYMIVGKNIGSDLSVNTFISDTLDIRTDYIPGSLKISSGPNSGSKTDQI
jgi:conserved repeat domain